MTKALVCGGRDFDDVDFIVARLNEIHSFRQISTLIAGGARGTDTIAELWADELGVSKGIYKITEEDWNRYGKSAGPRRNEHMLKTERPDVVVGFPGGNGTAHMLDIARKAGVEVIEFPALYFRKEDPEFGFLSNFHMAEQTDDDGCVWYHNEGWYQSRKTLSEKLRGKIQTIENPREAKRAGAGLMIRPNWDSRYRFEAMRDGLRQKFQVGSALAQRLVDTWPHYLIEFAPWGDTFWGVGRDKKGQNWLGRMLNERRDVLRKTSTQVLTALDSLRVLLDDMDLPSERKKLRNGSDIRWVSRNMAVRNADHPRFAEAHSLTVDLLRQMV